jgi:hypothetical protein
LIRCGVSEIRNHWNGSKKTTEIFNFIRCNDIGNANVHHYDNGGMPGYNRAMWIVNTQNK